MSFVVSIRHQSVAIGRAAAQIYWNDWDGSCHASKWQKVLVLSGYGILLIALAAGPFLAILDRSVLIHSRPCAWIKAIKNPSQ